MVLRIFLFTGLLIACAFSGQSQQLADNQTATESSIEWVSINDLEELQKKEPRKVLVDVYTKWCGPCKLMLKQTFHDPEVVNYINEHYYAVKFNAEGDEVIKFKGYEFTNDDYKPNKPGRNSTHDFTLAIAPVNGRIAYPTIVYLDEDLNIIFPLQGLMRPPQIMPLLTYINQDKFKDTKYEEFLKEYEQKGSQ